MTATEAREVDEVAVGSVVRFSRAERWLHWSNATLFLILLATGMTHHLVGSTLVWYLAKERTSGLWSRPHEGARRALEAIADLGLRRCVISNSDGRAAQHLQSSDVHHGLEFVVDSHDFGAEKLKATKAPMFFIHGDADGIRLEHVAEMFRLKGGEIHGDMKPRSASRLAILPNTTHVTLMQRMPVIVPMVNDFLDAKP